MRFFDEVLSPLLPSAKSRRQEHICISIVAQLIVAGVFNKTIALRKRDNRIAARVLDAIVARGYCVAQPGSEQSNMVTRYYAQENLLRLRTDWTIAAPAKKVDTPALVELRSDDTMTVTEDVPAIGDIRETVKQQRELAERIERINKANGKHAWRFVGRAGRTFGVITDLHAVFRDTMERGGRLYTWSDAGAQNLSKEQRRTLRIDDEATVEIDISACQLRIVYHAAGIDPDRTADLYATERIFPKAWHRLQRGGQSELREVVKKSTLILINAPDFRSALGAVHATIFTSPEPVIRAIRTDEKSGPKDMVERIVNTHPAIASWFGAGKGLELQRIESRVMLDTLEALTRRSIPALGIHDAVIVKKADAKVARSTLMQCYRSRLNFAPVLKG